MAYPNNWVDDGKVWVYYDISDISSATTILYQTTNLGSTMNVDGTDVAIATTYQFSDTGEHLIKYTLSGSTWGQQLRNIKTITNVFLPSTVTVIGSQAFQGSSVVECHGAGVATIGGVSAGWGGGAFTQVTSVVTLDFPSLTTIQMGGCYQCTKLETIIGLENLTTLVGYGLAGCSKLGVGESITFHNLTSLPNPGLNDLGFTRIYLPKVVTSNGGSGTGNCGIGACHKVELVEFGSDVTSIGGYNLGHSENLRRVHIFATTPPSLGTGFLYNNSVALIYVPAESLQAYKEASGWSNYASRIFPLGDEKRLNINHMSLGDFRRRIMLGISEPRPLPPPGVVFYDRLIFDANTTLDTGLPLSGVPYEWEVVWTRTVAQRDLWFGGKKNYNSLRELEIGVRQYYGPVSYCYFLYNNSVGTGIAYSPPLNTPTTFVVSRPVAGGDYTFSAGGASLTQSAGGKDYNVSFVIYGGVKELRKSILRANGIVVQNLRPCTYYGEAGMWDTINDSFIGNASQSGTFTVGND